jgi:hypothetical protein
MSFSKIYWALIPMCFLQSCSNQTSPINDTVEIFVQPGALLQADYNSVLTKDSSYTQGVSAVDINGDGYPELYATNSWTNQSNFFYKNNHGEFIKDDSTNLTRNLLNGNGCSWGDVDNDGKLDLAVANVNNASNFLFKGGDEGKFTIVELAQFNPEESWTYGSSWVDVDNDGYLDLYLANFKNQQNVFYQNIRGVLTEKDLKLTSSNSHATIHCVWSDLNNDGLPDLILSGEKRTHIYKNLGHFMFEELIDQELVLENMYSYGCSVADFNNDGNLDLFFANWNLKNCLYVNKGNWRFEKISKDVIGGEATNSEGSCWGDFDNDGWIDLAVSNDGDNSLFRNIKGVDFRKIEVPEFTDTVINSNALVWFDKDKSGFLDLYVANGGNQLNQFFVNTGNSNNWLKVKLTGTISNKPGIGAKVKVYTESKVQTQEVNTQAGGGCGSQKSLTLHFGLGKDLEIDSVIVHWPSGLKSKLEKPEVQTELLIREQ